MHSSFVNKMFICAIDLKIDSSCNIKIMTGVACCINI